MIARLDIHSKLQKRLVGLLLTDDSGVTQGARVTARGNNFGRVTSASYSLLLNHAIALAYIRSGWTAPNTRVEIAAHSGNREARVVQLPFGI